MLTGFCSGELEGCWLKLFSFGVFGFLWWVYTEEKIYSLKNIQQVVLENNSQVECLLNSFCWLGWNHYHWLSWVQTGFSGCFLYARHWTRWVTSSPFNPHNNNQGDTTGIPCFNVPCLIELHRCCSFFTNGRPDSPPAKRLQLALLEKKITTDFIEVIWNWTCSISAMPVLCTI